MLYTDINHHVGTSKQNTKEHYQVLSKNLEVQFTWTCRVLDYDVKHVFQTINAINWS